MFRALGLLPLIFAILLANSAVTSAQEVDISFSEVKLRELGYPEIEITVGPDGVDAPSELAAGFYLISLHPTEEFSAYLDIMQPPPGLTEQEATRLALNAAQSDLAQPDWKYLGGANTFEVGVPVTFAIHLEPGEYVIAASYYGMEQDSEEIMTLKPLLVTGDATPEVASASPVSAEASPVANAPVADVRLEMTDDLQYIVSPDPVPSGPQLWEVRNTGTTQSHHLVMQRIPDGVTADQIVTEFTSLFAGTPPAGEPLLAKFVYVGYAALQSGGYTTWQEYDLEPGTYAITCFIIDPATGESHLLNGMVTTFVVE